MSHSMPYGQTFSLSQSYIDLLLQMSLGLGIQTSYYIRRPAGTLGALSQNGPPHAESVAGLDKACKLGR